jgi:ribosomal protein L37AE/L43A
MTRQSLFDRCPLCDQGVVVWREAEAVYACEHCGLRLKERAFWGLFKRRRRAIFFVRTNVWCFPATASPLFG